MENFKNSRAAYSAVRVQIWLNFKLTRGFMVVLVTCKNEVDPIKSEGARVVTILDINFSDAQGKFTVTCQA